MSTTAVVVIGAVLGLLIGSFVNVVAHRVPAGVSVIAPPSACPRCGHEIRRRDNIPVVGWFLVRGRCRDCGEPVSVRYPLVEAITSVLFAATAAVLGPVWVLPAYWWFVAVTVTLALTDLDVKRIPNRILYPGTVVAAVLLVGGAALDGTWGSLRRSAAGAAGYFAVLLLIALVARGGFGFGDVKLAFLLGGFAAYRSWEALVVAVLGGFIIGGVVGVVLLLAQRVGRKETIPFGPAMITGAYLAIAFGAEIADRYLA